MINIILTTALIILIIMTITWFISLLIGEMSIVDVGWGLGFILITLLHVFRLENVTTVQLIMTAVITLWGLRLATYIFIRNKGKGEDPRYKAWRNDWGKNTWWISYFKVFLLQGVLMLLIALPIQAVMWSSGNTLSMLQVAGIAIWTVGFLFETIGDWQLYRFKSKAENKGKVMQSGLWRYTRHPNYFGESLVWWGVFFISIGSGNIWLSLISPVLLTFMLLKVSGVSMLEARYAGNDAYSVYKRTTSAFLPLPPKRLP
ncbi:MAG: DUF1295 domain-containing protein [Chitinophagales bacterium]